MYTHLYIYIYAYMVVHSHYNRVLDRELVLLLADLADLGRLKSIIEIMKQVIPKFTDLVKI